MSPNVLALLPEILLTLFGVVIMLAEPVLPAGRSRRPLGWIAIVGTLAAAAASLYQLGFGTVHAFFGTIEANSFSVFFHLLIAAVVLVTLLGSLDYFEAHLATPTHAEVIGHAGEYFALVLFGAVGMMLMTSATELLVIFVGLEISSIATYILCGFRKGIATGSESSIKYFLLGSFATAFFLYGIALIFGATGTTNLTAITTGAAPITNSRLAFLALAMILIGMGFKVSAAPFQVWTPDVYQGAPAPVVGLMSTAPKAAAFAVLLRILFSGFPALEHRWSALLWILAALSMCVGNLGALLQRDVKRMLAYSSIAHAGYLLVAFTAFPADGIAAACFYTAAYAAMNVGAFAVITQLTGYDETARSLEDFTGMAAKRPVLTALFAFFLLSLIGIPFTGGFFGKFYVFTAALHAGNVWLAVIGLLNSGVACFYYLRLIAALYTRPETSSPAAATRTAPGFSPAAPAAFNPATSAAFRPAALSSLRPSGRALSLPATVGIGLAALATLLLGILPGRALSLAQQGSAASIADSHPTPTTEAIR